MPRAICGFASMLVLFVLFIAHSDTAYGKEKRVVIMPFNLNAEKDLSFLKEGIHSMLISRLSWNGNVIVLGMEETHTLVNTIENPINETLYRDIGNKLAADYILFGSITVVENRLSIDIKVADINKDVPLNVFSRQSQDMDDVIPQINLLAEEINEKVFGRRPSRGSALSNPSDPSSSIYAHPERLLENPPE